MLCGRSLMRWYNDPGNVKAGKAKYRKNSFREYVCNADQQRANPVRALLRRYLVFVANEELRMEVFGF